MKKCLIGIFALVPLMPSYALDPYVMLDHLIDHKLQPRLLNTADLKEWHVPEAQPLLTPTGDFNSDGHRDVLISGIYGFPNNKPYFLLMASQTNSTTKRLFFKEYDNPVFIYKPGTTGKADPGDQLFSISFCWECEIGQDFYWNKKKKLFDQVAWKARKEVKQVEVEEENQVPEEIVDKALRLVAPLPDVRRFIAHAKKKSIPFATRVEKSKSNPHQVWVLIIEKTKKGEKEYDRILVDVEKEKILMRSK